MQHIILFTLLLFAHPAALFTEDKSSIKVAVAPIKYLLNTPEKAPGPYNVILSTISQLDIYFMPPARVDRSFYDFTVDCMFPASTQNMSNLNKYIESRPVNTTQAFLFSPKIYHDTNSFIGKNIGIKRGLSMGDFKDKFSAQFVELKTNEALIDLLASGRIDAFLAYEVDAIASYKAIDREPDFYLSTTAVYCVTENFVCHNTPKNNTFIEQANAQITALEESGELEDILQTSQ